MAKEYIEREAAKRELLSWAVSINHPEYLIKDDALHVIDSIPAADVVEQEQESKPTNGWISVQDRLPEKDGQYLIFTTQYFTPDHIDEIDHKDGIEISRYHNIYGFLSKNGMHAKYWCEMPQPPKGE